MELKDTLEILGYNIIKEAKQNLYKQTPHGQSNVMSKSSSSGALMRSLKFSIIGDNGDLELDFSMLPYGYLVDQGRQPGPISKDAENNLLKWMKRRGLDEDLLFVIKRSIQRHGYKATKFFTDSVDDNYAKVDQLIDNWVESNITSALIADSWE